MKSKKDIDNTPYWIYWDSYGRYWCNKHIDQAIKLFKKEVIKGAASASDIIYLQNNLDEIGYMCGDIDDEEMYCETCGIELGNKN